LAYLVTQPLKFNSKAIDVDFDPAHSRKEEVGNESAKIAATSATAPVCAIGINYSRDVVWHDHSSRWQELRKRLSTGAVFGAAEWCTGRLHRPGFGIW
jgi:hypothetical protein